MIYRIPKQTIKTTCRIPGSKSDAHRLLILASLFEEETVVENVNFCRDVEATLSALRTLGCRITVEKESVTICGVDYRNIHPTQPIFCDESGSTLRFLLPLCLGTGEKVTFYGAHSLFQRPLDAYKPFCTLWELTENSLTVQGNIPDTVTLNDGISSQFATGILFAHTLSQTPKKLIWQHPVSRPYFDLTLCRMRDFGISVEEKDNTYTVCYGEKKTDRAVCTTDATLLAYMDAFNSVGHHIAFDDVNTLSNQPDLCYAQLFDRLKNEKAVVDVTDCPDLAPMLFALSALWHGADFIGIRRLRGKESNRVEGVLQELSKFGIRYETREDRVTVFPSVLQKPQTLLKSNHDHRLAMCLSLLCTLTGGELFDGECVEKSYPEYYKNITIERIEHETV